MTSNSITCVIKGQYMQSTNKISQLKRNQLETIKKKVMFEEKPKTKTFTSHERSLLCIKDQQTRPAIPLILDRKI